ncbi:MAG: type II secretion system F family protein, partial [Planctomycetes bacterium]|nr:type II secretion system F family protein [Planctomycetota bacterium]
LASGWILIDASHRVQSSRRLQQPQRYRTQLSLFVWASCAIGLTVIVVSFIGVDFALITRGEDLLPVAIWAVVNTLLWFLGAVFVKRAAPLVGIQLSLDELRSVDRKLFRVRMTGWVLVLLPILVLFSPGMMILVLIAIAAVFILTGKRRANQGMVLWTLAVSVAKGLPLPEELTALADGISGGHRDKTRRLSELLHEGVPLDVALAGVPGVVPQFAVLAAQMGTKNGTLPKALRDAAVRHTAQAQWRGTGIFSPTLAVAYLLIIPTIAGFIVNGIMIFIIPKFKKIFEGFDVELPEVTVIVIEASDFFMEYLFLFVPLTAVLPLGAVLVAVAYYRGWGEFDIPYFSRCFRRLDLPGILRNLANTVASGSPLEDSLAVLNRNHRRNFIRNSFGRVLLKCQQGDDCWYAMKEAGLLNDHEVAVLRSAQRVGNLSWALEELAETIERRVSYRWLMVWEIAQPAVVLILGLGLGLICVAFFLPLVELLNNMS